MSEANGATEMTMGRVAARGSKSDILSPVCVFDREKLFPSAVAQRVGLQHDAMAILEIPNASTSLYNALLLYAANFAVDVDKDFTEDPVKKEEVGEGKLDGKKVEKAVEEEGKVKMNGGKGGEEGGGAAAGTKNVYTVKGLGGVVVPTRDGGGEVSSLWNCPVDRYDPFVMSDSDSDDSDSEGGSDEDFSSVDAVLNAGKKNSTWSMLFGVGSLRKKVDPPVQRYQMGLGFAKLRLGDKVVYMHHWGYGLPVSKAYSIQVFRTVVLAGCDPHDLKELCAVALKWRTEREQDDSVPRPGRFMLYRFKTNGDGSGDWSNQGYKRSRLPKSVILPEGQLEAIVKDMKDFCAKDTKVWYEAHGLPHRRSYLFHGPPGCGKTSTIRMIAGMFRLNACFLSLTAGDFSNQVLQDALTSIPRRALLVLEDVDVLFNEDRKSETAKALTFSGMLNALDGLISVDGIITVFTTNHIEKLDAALIRGGRVDRRFEFVHPNHKQMCALFLSFYEDAPKGVPERFADAVLSRPETEARSIATLQQHFIYTRKMGAEECVDMLPTFFSEFYPKGGQVRNPLYI